MSPNLDTTPFSDSLVRPMDLRTFISDSITAFPKAITADAVARASSELGISPAQFCDIYAREVADAYLAGQYSWTEGDAAMNALWFYIAASLTKESSLPDYAFGVFLAFDAGEIVDERSSDSRTTGLLNALHEKA